MSIELETLIAKIEADLSGLKEGLDEANRRSNRAAKDMEDAFSKAGTALKRIFSVGAIIGAAKYVIDAFTEQERAAIRLTASLRLMGRYTPELEKQLLGMASKIQSEGIIPDDAVVAAQARLSQFATIATDQLGRATQAAADLAATVGTDIESAAVMLGRASEGTTTQLAKMGLTISKTATDSKDFGKVLTEIEAKVGGMNRLVGQAASGSWTQLGNSVEQAAGQGGRALSETLGPAVRAISEGLGDLAQWLSEIDFTPIAEGVQSVTEATKVLAVAIWKVAGPAITAFVKALGKIVEYSAVILGPVHDALMKLGEAMDMEMPAANTEKAVAKLGTGLKDNLAARASEARTELEKLLQALEHDAATVGMTNEQIKLYDLAQAGATKADLERAKSLLDVVAASEEAKKSQEDLKSALDTYGAMADPLYDYKKQLKELDVLMKKFPEHAKTWQAAQVEVQKNMKKTMDELDEGTKRAGEAAKELGMTFSSALEDAIVEGQSLGDVLKALEKDIVRIITRKAVTEPLANSISGMFSGSSGSGSSGGGFWESLFSGMFAAAEGGDFSAGDKSIVGERGPEIVEFKRPARVFPTSESKKMMRGAGNTNVNNYISVQAPNGQVDPRSISQIQAAASLAVRRGSRNT